jgi:outer membrane cobalamin receptor
MGISLCRTLHLTIFTIVTFVSLAGGAPSGTLSGFIHDKSNGESLAFANIILKGATLGASSNTSGYYAVTNIPPGTYTVIISLLGYKTHTAEIAIDGDRVANFELTGEAIQVGEMTISAERIEQRSTTQTGLIVMKPRDVESIPAVGEVDIFRALQMMPGIKSSSDISSGLYIRGGGPDENLILLDGTIVYNPSHLFGFFSTFNNDAIKDIELLKGGFPAEYGGRLSSVLNVTNKDGNRMNFQGKASISLISARLTAEGPLSFGSWFLSARRTYFDQFMKVAGLDKGDEPLPLYYFYDANGKVNVDINQNNKLSFVGYLGQDDLSYNLKEDQIDMNMFWGNRTGALKYTSIFSPQLFANFVATGSYYKSQMTADFSATDMTMINSISDYSLKGDLDYYLNIDNFLKVGFWWSQYRIGVVRKFADNVFYDVVTRPALIAFYAEDEWNATTRLKFQVGVRCEYQDMNKKVHIAPRFSTRFAITDDIALKFGTGVYYQYLNLVSQEGLSFFDLWLPIGNDMAPGRASDIILGLETHPSEGYDLSLETYYKTYNDIVEFKTEETRTTDIKELFNIGTGRAYGAELFLQKKIGALTGFVGYSLAWTYRNFPEINGGKDYQPKYDRRHDLSLSLNYQFDENWKFSLAYTYATGQTYTRPVGRYVINTPVHSFEQILPGDRYNGRLEPYHRLDVSVNKKFLFFGLKGNYYLQIFNVYSHKNVWFKMFDTDKNPVEITDVRLLPIIPTIGFDFEF